MFSVFLAGIIIISLGVGMCFIFGQQISSFGFKFMFKALAVFLFVSFVLGPVFFQLTGRLW